jgi:hypothetical protein
VSFLLFFAGAGTSFLLWFSSFLELQRVFCYSLRAGVIADEVVVE